MMLPLTAQHLQQQSSLPSSKYAKKKQHVRRLMARMTRPLWIVLLLVILYVASWIPWLVHTLSSLKTDDIFFYKAKINNFFEYEVTKPYKLHDDFIGNYPLLQVLQDNYEILHEEAQHMVDIAQKVPTLHEVGGKDFYPTSKTKWHTFFLVAGRMVHENKRHAPKTFEILKGLWNQGVIGGSVMISVLEPHQHIYPHWGYFKGFEKYHLGLIIPKNNADKKCYLHTNLDFSELDPEKRDMVNQVDPSIFTGPDTYTYYWKNNESVMFDDTYVHDATNDSDEYRVVLFVDVFRRYPWYAFYKNLAGPFINAIAYRHPWMKEKIQHLVIP